MEIVAIIAVVLLALLFAFLIYKSVRTYDAGAHATFITAKGGEYYGALRAPITLWNPMVKVLKDKHAPAISIITLDPSGTEYFEKSLVTRRTGEVSLRVHVCAPRPFISRTSEKKQLRIKTRVAFQLDIERIQIPSQMEAFGATLGARIENLFDNAIGQYEDQEVFAKQSEIEASVLRQLQDIEFPPDPMHPAGMPLGIKVYEAIFSYEPVSSSGVTGDGIRGPMAYAKDDLDDLADMLEKADPKTVEVIMRMMEMQTRQNIVELLCKSGGLVAFTAPELGLSERPIDRALSGINRMSPVVTEPAPSPAQPAGSADGSAAAAPVDPATAYYGLGAPKQH